MSDATSANEFCTSAPNQRDLSHSSTENATSLLPPAAANIFDSIQQRTRQEPQAQLRDSTRDKNQLIKVKKISKVRFRIILKRRETNQKFFTQKVEN
jgi:hypothetical protein